MKKSLMVILAILACSTSLAFAANTHGKGTPSPKSEHDITVGNEKAADSGSTADDKTAKTAKSHTNHGKTPKKN